MKITGEWSSQLWQQCCYLVCSPEKPLLALPGVFLHLSPGSLLFPSSSGSLYAQGGVGEGTQPPLQGAQG